MAGQTPRFDWSLSRMNIGPKPLQRKCDCGERGECAGCAADSIIQRNASSPVTNGISSGVHRIVLNSGGLAIDADTRHFFESRFHHDFSDVRLHTDNSAARSATALSANAYTLGNHIVFGSGKYKPQTKEGRRLVAHELGHVIQQSQGYAGLVQRQEDAGTPSTEPTPGPAPEQLGLGSPDLANRSRQVACVVRRGGCPQSRAGGQPSAAEIAEYNELCREDSNYRGDPIHPSPEECANPPPEPLSTGTKILLGAFLGIAALVVLAAVVYTGGAILPVVLASVTQLGTGAWAFYLANAIVVDEIGVFAAGVVISCEGDVAGLLRAIANDPIQAVPLLAQGIQLHLEISVLNGPSRRAIVQAQLLPPEEQTVPNKILFKTKGPPQFEGEQAPVTGAPGQAAVAETTTSPPVAEGKSNVIPIGSAKRGFAESPELAPGEREISSLEEFRARRQPRGPKPPPNEPARQATPEFLAQPQLEEMKLAAGAEKSSTSVPQGAARGEYLREPTVASGDKIGKSGWSGTTSEEVGREIFEEAQRLAPERAAVKGRGMRTRVGSAERPSLQLSHSAALRADLEKAGIRVTEGHDAHHIVPTAGGGEAGDRARSVLVREGINPDTEPNGVPLPRTTTDPRTIPEGLSRHQTIHTDTYYEALADRLEAAPSGTVKDLLRQIRNEIVEGKFPH
jgi:hypothetical protein